MRSLSRLLKKLLAKYGVGIYRHDIRRSHELLIVKFLKPLLHKAVIDVGANTGQFATGLIDAGYDELLLSIEPLSQAHRTLESKARQHRSWSVADRMAVGPEEKEVSINRSNNSVSSSVLKMTASHVSASAGSECVDQELVRMRRLDSVLTELLSPATQNIFLKIDAQGYELQVLSGLGDFWDKVCGIKLELSLHELYEEQVLWLEMLSFMEDKGFKLWNLEPGFTHPHSGLTLQMDGIFISSKFCGQNGDFWFDR